MTPATRPANEAGSFKLAPKSASWLFLLLLLMTVSAMLLNHGAAPWVELAYRLFTDGIVLATWLVSAVGVGSVVVLLLVRQSSRDGTPLFLVASFAAGVGVLSLVVLLLGLAGWLTATTAWALVVVGPLLLAVPATRRAVRPPRTSGSAVRIHVAVLSLAPVAAMWLVAAMTPPGILWRDEPHPYDVLSYHLQLPREWLELGRIRPLEHNVFSFFPLNVEMHYLLAMHLRGGAFAGMYLAQLMHAAMAMLVPAAIHGALRDRGRFVAASGAALAGTSPWLLLLGGVAYNEAGLLLFATLAVVFAMRSMGDAGTRGEMVLAGLFAGLACGTKLTAVPTVLVAIPVAMTVARLVARRSIPPAAGGDSRRPPIGDVAAFLLAGLLSFSPWLVRNVTWTGNPVFPEMTGLFGRAHFTEAQVERWQAAHSPREDQRSITARAGAFLDHAVRDWRGGHVLGGLIIIGIVAGFYRRAGESILVAALLLLTLAFWLGFTHLQGRFLAVALPLAALLLGSLPAGWARGAAAAAIVSLAVGLLHAGPQLERSAGVLGLGDLTPLLRASLPDERWVDRLLGSEKPVVLVGDARAFLYAIPMSRLRYRTVFDVSGQDLQEAYVGGRGGGGLLLVDPGELRRLSRTYRHFPTRPEAWLAGSEPVLIDR